MTLNVSLCVPDGIVIACDSLATYSQALNQKMNVSAKCDRCDHQFEIKDVQVPPMSVPRSTWAYSQKLFPIQRRCGLAVYGSGFVNGRSMYNHIIELGPKLPACDGTSGNIGKICDAIKDYFHKETLAEIGKLGQDPQLLPDSFVLFGFQVVGFEKGPNGECLAERRHILVGKNAVCSEVNGPCYVSGDLSVVSLLWSAQALQPNFSVFSLQDAIDYAKFLIRTTSDYQRFSGNMPTVGGEIDIALVTNHRGFQWIAQKELYRKLDAEDAKK